MKELGKKRWLKVNEEERERLAHLKNDLSTGERKKLSKETDKEWRNKFSFDWRESPEMVTIYNLQVEREERAQRSIQLEIENLAKKR